ncbi:MAG: RdgB/HAM1 family non-canonical purine NTP pyrophosphatase [Treponemataceae bacterium]|nr:RdgB/HAM1 family non-canonical purine NTP pyrophosphatase [Treponemataceae bacterium]
MNIYLATGNKNKKREMAHILCNHTIVTPDDEGIAFNPVESGTTFYENSIIKARTLFEAVRSPVIADDSGICVDALGGAPGIYSARYAGPDAPHGRPDGAKMPQDEQNRLLLRQLDEAQERGAADGGAFLNGPRSAHYTCAMVLYLGGDRIYVAQETMEGALVGSIAEAAGDGGFGYDPIFFLPDWNKTAAELSAAEKNSVSHRGKAVRALVRIIDGLESIR